MAKPYALVESESLICKTLLLHAKLTPDDQWVPYYNFVVTPVPGYILKLDSFIMNLARIRKFHAGILRMNPNTCYNWHSDTDRKVGLNMLIEDDGDSRTLFIAGEPGVVFDTEELRYKPDMYYAFNTQVPHMVLNTSKPRYLFSLEFLEEDRGLTFNELCRDIEGLSYVN